jgi:hypothetical protein
MGPAAANQSRRDSQQSSQRESSSHLLRRRGGSSRCAQSESDSRLFCELGPLARAHTRAPRGVSQTLETSSWLTLDSDSHNPHLQVRRRPLLPREPRGVRRRAGRSMEEVQRRRTPLASHLRRWRARRLDRRGASRRLRRMRRSPSLLRHGPRSKGATLITLTTPPR